MSLLYEFIGKVLPTANDEPKFGITNIIKKKKKLLVSIHLIFIYEWTLVLSVFDLYLRNFVFNHLMSSFFGQNYLLYYRDLSISRTKNLCYFQRFTIISSSPVSMANRKLKLSSPNLLKIIILLIKLKEKHFHSFY